MNISTEYLARCIKSLETGVEIISETDVSDKLYDVYRSAVIKEFELTLEQSGKLLRKALRPYFASNRQADKLTFRQVFCHATKHCVITPEFCERWLVYRKNRNDTAHDYGQAFADQTLPLLPEFVQDAKALLEILRTANDDD